ncbi:MAG: hypothetical protein M1369_04565, partial [Deinococcus sp.]|nr:hypothetical protein [Deinococcus sp.]
AKCQRGCPETAAVGFFSPDEVDEVVGERRCKKKLQAGFAPEARRMLNSTYDIDPDIAPLW